ncbi:MAG: glycosyltransferase family 4 protein [Candidatus Marinimicrobia bacterium]|nr:glycosyltransferase family 4 protein [Candidatus Neomarinimicrobiota bacterium]
MKIGIYTGTIPPPVFINNLINGLANKNDTVIVYGKVSERNYKFSSSAVVQRKVPITKLGILLYSIYTLSKLIIMQPQFCVKIVKLVMQNSTNWIQFFKRSCKVLPPFLDNLDIFHIQWAKSLVNYPEFIELLTCPVVLSLRGAHINYSPLSDKKLSQGYMKYFPDIAGFHAVSMAIAREAEKYGAVSKKIKVIPPAVKIDLIKKIFFQNHTYKNDELKIISVGRCHWKKGFTFALDAMAILKKKVSNFQYTIIAGGKDEENLLFQIHDLGLSENVTFINGLPHQRVIKKISESNIFLLPSVEEGISNAVLEAMALGIHVISTNCGGMAEVIENKINGFLVEVREPLQISTAIQSFINSSNNEKMELVNHAQKTIRENHLLNRQINEMVTLYSSTINGIGVDKN